MNFKYILLSSLASVSFIHAQNTTEIQLHNGLNTAIQQIDTDGEFLKLEKSGDLLEKITTLADEYLLPQLKEEEEISKNFSFKKILAITGVNEITARSESVKKADNSYITKHFIQTNGSRKGIFSFLGKADLPWASLSYAPANTAMILETHLDLSSLPKIMKQVAPLLVDNVAAEMLAPLSEADPVANKTVEEILKQIDTRISIVATLDSTKTWGPPSQKIPVIHATGRIDGIAKFIWENYGQTISDSLPVQSEGNVHTIISPVPVEMAWGPLTPVLKIDTDNNHIWVSVSAEHLELCMSGKTNIIQNKDFQLANKGSRDSGAARIYLSKQLTKLGVDLLEANLKEEIDEPIALQVFEKVVTYLHSLDSISSTTSHDQKGILINTHAPFPLRYDQVVNINTIASLAGLSYGPIMKHLESSKRTNQISQMKGLYSALLGYMAENNNTFPENLQQLVDSNHISQENLTIEDREITYIKGLSILNSNKIILYTTADLEGNTICARVDGSVTVINESELEELLTAQQK